MLRGVLIGLLVLVLAVFVYVGYSSYAVGKSSGSGEVYADGMVGGRTKTGVKAEQTTPPPTSVTLPATSPTGDGNAMVAQGGGTVSATGVAPPASDTIAPNPPNGMTFGGSGHFQLYRQGDLTWRLNTDTGETCVLFATDEEWRKPKVFKAGCRGK